MAVFFKNHLKYKQINKDIDFGQTEVLTIQITTAENDTTLITTLYKPPDTDNNEFLQVYEYFLEYYRKDHVVIGDLNIDILKPNATVDKYNSIIVTNGYKIINEISEDAATRSTDTSVSVIDHIVTNIARHVSYDIIDTTLSDHNMLAINVDIKIQKRKMEYHTIKTVDYVRVKQYLQSELRYVASIRVLNTVVAAAIDKHTTNRRSRTRGHM